MKSGLRLLSLAGADGGVQMISRPRISGNWPPTVVGIGSDIRFDPEAAAEFVCGGREGGGVLFVFMLLGKPRYKKTVKQKGDIVTFR